MKKFLISAASLGALALTYVSTAAVADEHDVVSDNESVTFSELTLADGAPDDGTCAERYGTDYRTSSNAENTLEQTHNTTVDGHDIVISSTGGTIGMASCLSRTSTRSPSPMTRTKSPLKSKSSPPACSAADQPLGFSRTAHAAARS